MQKPFDQQDGRSRRDPQSLCLVTVEVSDAEVLFAAGRAQVIELIDNLGERPAFQIELVDSRKKIRQ